MKHLNKSSYLYMEDQCDQRTRLKEPRLMPLEESEWNRSQALLLNPLKKHFKDGRVYNLFTTMARHPKLYDSWSSLGNYIFESSTIPAREREILILRIGWLCRCEYEFGQHILIGKKEGLSDEEILRITKGPDARGWSTFDALLIRATDELYLDAFIKDETWQALSLNYNEKQLLDLIFTVGEYNMLSMLLNSCGIQRDPGVPGFPEGAGNTAQEKTCESRMPE